MKFREKLQRLRAVAHLSQGELAERSGVPPGTIRNLEQGIRLPTWPTLVRLVKALGASIGDFDECELEDAPAAKSRPQPTAPPPRRTGRMMPGKARHRRKGE
jgi:transcriptional regulator with XRE-family HTH domain